MKKSKKQVFCSNCGEEIMGKVSRCPQCNKKVKKPFYKRIWFIVLLLFLVVGTLTSGGDDTESKVEVQVLDFSEMSKEEIQSWGTDNSISISFETDYSDSIETGGLLSQSKSEDDVLYEGQTLTIVYSLGEEPSTEYKNALSKAETYSDYMNMSKQGIYDQLVSEYGEQFDADAAQYAIDNLYADYNANALAKAESYSETMNMSKQGIYDQLTSEYGEQFTAEQAQYAVDNLDVDYNANALAKAKSYQDTMNMSVNAIYDQLVSEYGEQFTAEQAQYAIDNLEE